jgi:hypothetical protein
MEKLKKMDFKLVLLLLLGASSLFFSPTVLSSICVLTLGALLYQEKQLAFQTKPEADIELKQEVSHLKNQVSSIMMKSAKPEAESRPKRMF